MAPELGCPTRQITRGGSAQCRCLAAQHGPAASAEDRFAATAPESPHKSFPPQHWLQTARSTQIPSHAKADRQKVRSYRAFVRGSDPLLGRTARAVYRAELYRRLSA